MTTALAVFLLASAIALSNFGQSGGLAARRLARFVPARSSSAVSAAGSKQYANVVYRVLRAVNPFFAAREALLLSLGISHPLRIAAIETAKFLTAICLAALAAVLVRTFSDKQVLLWTVPVAIFVATVAGVNKAISKAAAGRRLLIRRELAHGVDLLCIFIEGGQSLDQAFRSFCDICPRALPRITGIQRQLIADLNNGVPYEKAIERWADNLGCDEARALATLFIDSLVHGTEVVPQLRQISNDLTERRISNARASIGVKSSQLTVVMVVFFLPAILAFVAAPAIVTLAGLEISR